MHAEFDVTVILRCRDDEERIGHAITRVTEHLASLGQSVEVVVADEGSTDNSVAVATLLRRQVSHLEITFRDAQGSALAHAASRARGKTLLLLEANEPPSLSALGFVLGRLSDELDLFVVTGRYLAMRRTRTWRAFDALQHRDWPSVERRLIERARVLGLKHSEASMRSSRRRLRDFLPLPSLRSRAV